MIHQNNYVKLEAKNLIKEITKACDIKAFKEIKTFKGKEFQKTILAVNDFWNQLYFCIYWFWTMGENNNKYKFFI